MSNLTYCPECDSRIRFTKKVRMGQRVSCHECEEMLEVINTSPIELTWAFEDNVSVDRNQSFHEEYEYDYDESGRSDFNW